MLDYIIIPARGGSKRIKGKNLRNFLGKPMLARSIDLAKNLSKHIIVSSDHDDILQMAQNMGVIAKLRDETLSNDYATTLQVMHNVLLDIKNITPDSTILCLYPTAMFATEHAIKQALQTLINTQDISYVVPIIRQDKILRSFRINNGRIDLIFNDLISSRTQDLPACFSDSGQFYLGYAKSFLHNIPILGNKSATIELDYAHDIDTESDLAIAEALYTFMHAHNKI